MITPTITIDDRALTAQAEAARVSPSLMANGMKLLVRRNRKKYLKRLQYKPPPPNLPFIWSYDPVLQAKARGYWYAVRVPKSSQGGRYVRQEPGLPEQWEITTKVDDKGGVFYAENDGDGADFVYGKRQVPGHALWPNADKEAARISEEMSDDAVTLWFTVSDPSAGV